MNGMTSAKKNFAIEFDVVGADSTKHFFGGFGWPIFKCRYPHKCPRVPRYIFWSKGYIHPFPLSFAIPML